MISQSRYIRIVSGVGAGAGVAERSLSLRVVTTSNLVPPGVVMEFETADAVGEFFGFQSSAYLRAVRYFGFISKQIQSPKMISFVRQVDTAIPAMIYGDISAKSITSFTPLTAAAIKIGYNGVATEITGIDLSGASSLTNVATLLQTAFRANTAWAAIPDLANCTVTYNTNTNQFNLSAGPSGAGAGEFSLFPGSQGANDLTTLLGWGTAGSVLVKGQGEQTGTEAIQASANVSNNFGSFVFDVLDQNDMQPVAEWNHAQNNMYMFLCSVYLSEIAGAYTLLKGYSGTAVSIKALNKAEDYIDQFPGEILAATNYNTPNATQSYMYYTSATRNVSITDDAEADIADANRGNYIGVTQQAGQPLAFYQRGVLMGGAQDAVDMNTYANEMWFKGAITSKLFELFLNVGRVPANVEGEAAILSMIQTVVDNAKINGVISVGKGLTEIQKQYITQISADDTAWRQVQTIGYWLTVGFDTEVKPDGRTEYYATYTLIYSKDDVIRRVEGRDIMI